MAILNYTTSDGKQLTVDLDKLSPGAYNLVVIYKDKRYTKRVIKQ